MADILPYLRGTSGTINAQCLYPFVRSVSFDTAVNIFAGGQEQRWPLRAPFYNFALAMNRLNATDQAAWLTFFNAVNGRFIQDLQITLGTNTWNNLALLSDDLDQVNTSALLFSQTVNLRQTQNGSWTPPTPGTTFPTLSTIGAVAEQPYTTGTRFLTGYNDQPLGVPFVYAYFGSGRPNTNFPSTPLKRWTVEYQLLSQSDCDQLEAFFVSVMGRALSFTWTDPVTATSYPHVRFDQDALAVRYLTCNQLQTSISLYQTNGS
jgi:hypothetical protein